MNTIARRGRARGRARRPGDRRSRASTRCATRATTRSRSQGPPPGRVTTVTVVGDIMLGRGVPGRPALHPMQARLAAADITVGNLESTLSDAGPPTQDPVSDSFHADPMVRADLLEAGFDAMSLANNHTGDYGDQALVQTVQRLRGRPGSRPSAPVATWPRRGSRWCSSGTASRFGFLGFNAIGETPEAAPGQPGAVSISMPPRTGPLDQAELARFLDDVRRLAAAGRRRRRCCRTGATQYTYRPWPVQRQVARRLVAAGADLVVGGHPHWVQGASHGRRRAGRELARQLRLRHGLHGGDHGGAGAGGDVLGRAS